MTLQHYLALLAGIVVVCGLLFLSMIHLFMIPQDVRKRDTDVQKEEENMINDPMTKPGIGGEANREPKPEIDRDPDESLIEQKPEPEIKREPGVSDEPKPEMDPDGLANSR